ncbi:MAG: 2-dehydropantoate 2-reductase [Anaerolineae bacterium]|jgi:2-dehydropantoate 2-reductase|nr:2-dehydropantoate 2-reductase [Anaerolineae bacterium]MDH7475126.1 2-dehydropantoate 2-reductase [Anaerolineae bacterium]
MDILIVGAGAIGSLIGHRLARAGHQVILVGRSSYVAAVNERGIGLEEEGKVIWTKEVRAVDDIRSLEGTHFDLMIFTMKVYDTAVAAVQARPLVTEEMPVLVLQNGVGGEEIARSVLGKGVILSGVVTLAVEVHEPGLVSLRTSRGGLGLASTRRGYGMAWLADVMEQAGFRTRIFPDYRAMKWSKLLLNMLSNAIPAILDMPPQDVFANPDLFALERRALAEAMAVMRALHLEPVELIGYPVPLFTRALTGAPRFMMYLVFRHMVGGSRGGKPPSLHLDLQRGQTNSEVEYLNGAVVRAADRLNVPVPVNRALYELLMGIARKQIPWEDYRQRPDKLWLAVRSGTKKVGKVALMQIS